MAEIKGYRLYVNLGASQVRRRLRGFGHGVRKVQAAGRNQALIIHTATGQHRRELERVFSDVTPKRSNERLDIPIERLRNLGSASAAWLREVGIETRGDLERLGPALAYRLVKQRQPRVSLNLLWAMAAGLIDQDWRELSDQAKAHWLAAMEDD